MLAPETESAIAGALEVFAKVSRERVRVELVKMLRAARPSLGLMPMATTGLWAYVLAPLEPLVRDEAIAACDRLPPTHVVRLARLLWPIRHDRETLEYVVNALKPSREERAALLRLTDNCVDELRLALDAESDIRPVAIRQAAAAIERRYLDDAARLLELDERGLETLDLALEGAALTGKELAIKGRDLIAAEILKPGRRIGEVLAELLDWVIEDPHRNNRESLIAQARAIVRRD